MDRSIIAPWKAEEKELSEKLYKKINGLALLYPINDEFRKVLSWDMFLKPNQSAFFQVMHYLFRLLDPVEFKKRFFWPITDKRAEATFRSSTVEYLKHLNELHNLQWKNIKSYLVVMPGGMKFITFLLDFVSFVIRELGKQREKDLIADGETVESLAEYNLERMRRQDSLLKEISSAYIADMDEQIVVMREKINAINEVFNAISNETNISVAQLNDEKFLVDFESSNRRLIEIKVSKPNHDIVSLEQPLNDLKLKIEKFESKEAEDKYDADAVRSSLRTIYELFPTEVGKETDLFFCPNSGDGGIKLNTMIDAFNSVSSTIEHQLSVNDERKELNGFMTAELLSIKSDIDQIELQITECQKTLNEKAKKSTNKRQTCVTPSESTPLRSLADNQRLQQNTLMTKFVSTPPIKIENINSNRNASVRLPLLDDYHAQPLETFNLLLPRQCSARKLKRPDQSSDRNTALNRSKIIDPMQLLRTINKDTSKTKPLPQQNLSKLGTTWRQRQGLFGFDSEIAATSQNTSILTTTSSSTITTSMQESPLTPFNNNELTRIERAPLNDISGGAGNAANNSLIYSKKSAVMKVLDASLNVNNLSTSPSGRLDPLVTINNVETLKIKLNDLTLNESLDLAKANNKNTKGKENRNEYFTALDLSGNDQNDVLFDISDTVLKDITM